MAKGQKFIFDEETGSTIVKPVDTVNSVDGGKKKKRKRTKANNTSQVVEGGEEDAEEQVQISEKTSILVREITKKTKVSSEIQIKELESAVNESEEPVLGPLVPEKLLELYNTDHQFSEGELKFKSAEESEENSDNSSDNGKNNEETEAQPAVVTRITPKPVFNKKPMHTNGYVRNSHFQDSEDDDGASDSDDENSRANATGIRGFRNSTASVSLDPSSYKEQQRLKHQLLKVRETLPIYGAREELMARISKNQVTVLIGETGSGKSTQLPQFLYESMTKGKESGAIAITQPRRVAAINLAKRVSEEMGAVLGDKVGYSVRFQNCSGPNTKVKYLTDGMLLRELMSSPDLEKYSTIIIDEAHERTVLTDLIMGFLKLLLERRPTDLKVIIMSATLDAERFSKFFNNADILFVEGKMYPVERLYLAKPVNDIVDSAVQTVIQINSSEPTGDILVFLPGQEEIDKSVDMINELALQLSKNAPLLVALPLYASLPPAKQQMVFETLPPRRRKVIFSTNVAETSLTISGVKYVVDTGLRKVKVWKHDLGLDTLLTTPISQASANQRMGRAGRESAGKCFRLFTEESYMELSKQTEPEILRCDVASAILMLKKAGIDDVLNFQWLQSPGKKAIIASLMKLYSLKALGDDGKITPLGEKMAILPVSPHLAAVLINAMESGVLSPCIDIVSCLSIENLLLNPHPEKRDEINELRRTLFAQGILYGDLAMLKQMFDGYQKIKNKHERKQWCKDIAVNSRGMKNVAEVRKQLRRYMLAFSTDANPIDFDYEDQENRDNQLDMKQVLKCFLRGYIGNTALGMPDRRYRTVVNGQTISIHPSSMMFGRRVEAIMYTEYVFTTKGYARTVCPIELSWLQEIAPHYLGRRITSNED